MIQPLTHHIPAIRCMMICVKSQVQHQDAPEQRLQHVVVHGSGSSQAENFEEQCAAELEQDLSGRDTSIDCQVPQGPMWSSTCISHLMSPPQCNTSITSI